IHLLGARSGLVGEITLVVERTEGDTRAEQLGKEDLGIRLNRVHVPDQGLRTGREVREEPDRLGRLAPNPLKPRVNPFAGIPSLGYPAGVDRLIGALELVGEHSTCRDESARSTK